MSRRQHDPCPDDGLFCNGTESCDEADDQCGGNGNPCSLDTQCNEAADTRDSISIASIPTLSEWGAIIFMTIIAGNGGSNFVEEGKRLCRNHQ